MRRGRAGLVIARSAYRSGERQWTSGASGFSGGREAEPAVRVMTWNLWGRFGPWQARAEAIAATMAEVRPDVCGLQEVWSAGDRNFAADLAERLGLGWRWAMAATTPTAEDPEVAGGNAILSRWPILGVANMPLPVSEEDQGRAAGHARIQAPDGVLPMFTTHFTHHKYASQTR